MITTTYLLLALFFAWMIWIGWRAGKVSADTKAEHFLIANRSAIGLFVAIGVVMSWVDATSFGYVGGMAFDTGWGVAPYILGAVGTFLWLATLAPRIRTLGANGNMYMMTDVVRQHFSSKRAGLVAGIAVHIYFLFWMMVQFIVGPLVVQGVLGIDPLITSCVMGGVTLIYLLLGGFRSQIYTDLAQFGLFSALTLVLVALFVPSAPQWVAPAGTFASLGLGGWISLFIISVAGTIAAPDVWQRIYSAKSEKDAKFAMFLCFALMSIVYLVFTAFGMIVKYFGWATTSSDVPTAIFQHIVPHALLPVAIVAFFAIIMSTIATSLFGASMAISNDIIYGLGFIQRERIIFWQRVVMVIVMISAIVVTASNLSIVSIVNYALAACLVPLPIVLGILYKIPFRERSAFWSMLVSLITFIGGMFWGILNGTGLLWPLGTGLVVLIVVEIISRFNTPKSVSL